MHSRLDSRLSKERPPKPMSRPAEVDRPSLFSKDLTGDRHNLTYESPDKHTVPRYQRAGHGRLLGLQHNYRITSRPGPIAEVEDAAVDSTRRVPKKTMLSEIAGENQTVTGTRSGNSDEDDLHKDFLKFYGGRSRKRRRLESDPGQAQAEDDESEETESEADETKVSDDAFEAFKKDPLHQKHLRLWEATEHHPDAPSTWLELIKFQDVLSDNNRGDLLSGGSSREIKISIYERALSRVKTPDGRHTLILGLMQEARAVWDTDKQASKWRTFLDTNASFDLWKQYVNFVQTNSVKFSFDDCLQTYTDWFRHFQGFRQGSTDRTRDSYCVYIVLRLTLFLWQSGFSERAVGIWQALLESNYYRPEEKFRPNLREFWEREIPRIGDEGSEGWNSSTHGDSDAKPDKSYQTHGMNLEQWTLAEMELDRTAGLPAKSVDDVPEEDPYRVVLFSDIQQFLFVTCSFPGRALLVDGFLLFAGLPPVSVLCEAKAWKGDPFICCRSLGSPLSLWLVEHAKRDYGMTTRFEEVFLATNEWNCSSLEANASSPGRLLYLYPKFVRRVISQVADLSGSGRLFTGMMEYAVAFESGIDLGGGRKLAKSFLKQQDDSLRLWGALAQIEQWRGNYPLAEKIWSQVLSMKMSADQGVRGHAFHLWRNWVYACMCQVQFRKARTLIGMTTDGDFDLSRLETKDLTIHAPPVSVQIKVEQHVHSEIIAAHSRGQLPSLQAMIDVLAFHKYLNNDLKLEAALETYEKYLRMLSAGVGGPAISQAIHEQRARFMYAHAFIFRKEYKPRDYSVTLSNSAQAFPNNFILLILHHYFAQKAGLIDRVHQLELSARRLPSTGSGDSLFPCIVDMLVELSRPAYAGSTNHSVRSAFRRVTEVGSPGHDSIETWKAFVLWEASLVMPVDGTITVGHDKAKPTMKSGAEATWVVEAFYASLRACPWSKELSMLAFNQPALKNALGEERLMQVCQNMVDRGMRMHIDVAETLL
ncbi:hypothetical protein H2200_009624 [Cladophialophora chaetospira]|uniref:DUF1740-domain-containing protein n=1 Tax=Cladophialophora chaetospira TaxID=386627 RepID=A0AA38X2W0_9EURO|nr:hypothetical protein H2200_009624 [Cladophialophora chaetospira]